MPGINKYPTIRLHSYVYENLEQPYGQSASVALSRYFYLLSIATLEFTESEWNLLRDACNGWATQSEPIEVLVQGLLFQVQDAIEFSQLDKKWQVDASVLIEKLAQLDAMQTIAVIDAIERWWGK